MSARGPADLPPAPAQHLFPGDLLAEYLERGEHSGQRARLAAMTAVQLEGSAASGWHCGFPRCPDPASYLSSLRYATRNGRECQRGRSRRHRRYGEKPCAACLSADNAAHAWRAALRTQTAYVLPEPPEEARHA